MPMNKLISFAFIFWSFDALAEVSDKMATIPELWLHGIVFGLGIYFLIRWRIGFILLAILFITFFAYAAFSTLSDPHVGVAVIREQGTPYIIASYSAPVIITICSVLGVIKNRRKLKRGI